MTATRHFLLALFICMVPFRVFSQETKIDTNQKLNANQMINEAALLMKEGNFRLAIGNKLDPIIQAFELQYKDSTKRIYGARTPEESLYYLVLVAAETLKENDANQKNTATDKNVASKQEHTIEINPDTGLGSSENAIVISPAWGNALFMKGSALVSLNTFAEAKPVLAEAVNLSPMNSMYLAEYAYVFIANKEYEKGLELATSAEAAANFSPDDLKNDELARAKRHMGFALIELGRLDEAKKKFKECLKLNRKDEKAKNELAYIEGLEKQQKNK